MHPRDAIHLRENGLKRCGAKPLVCDNHTEIGRGGDIRSVKCKLCGYTIKALIPDDTFKETIKKGTQTIVYERLILAELSNYLEIKIDFDDGSAHITHMCKGCFKSLRDEDLEALYIGDVLQMLAEGGVSDKHLGIWSRRRPTGFKLTRMNGREVI